MLRILLVEDETVISLVTSVSLEDAGYHVSVATDGVQGLEMALQVKPDLIITDYMMPRMSGLEMIKALREKGFDGYIVLTSAIPELSLPERAQYDLYLGKPYFEQDLFKVLAKLPPKV
jgi:CheY-like chemotaxis protein